MSGPEVVAGPILNAARRGGARGCPLPEIVREIRSSWGVVKHDPRIDGHTDSAWIGHALAVLVSSNLIEIKSSRDKEFSKKIRSFVKSCYSSGYQMAEFLHDEGEENISIGITPTLPALQDLLGISITDMVAAAKGGSIRIRPFFGEPDKDSSLKSDVFVLMPYKDELRFVYEDHIKKVCQTIGLSCQRADNFFRVDQIIRDIWSAIFLSNWIVADCTGRNPNVFYEMGIAHTMGKRVIIITQDENDVPFDIRHIRFFKYEPAKGMRKFEDDLKSALTSASLSD